MPGRAALSGTARLGRAGIFLGFVFAALRHLPRRWRQVIEQVHFTGNRSIAIVVLTGVFTGMVLVLQAYLALVRFGTEAYVGPLVALSLIRELGPVLAALMVTARAGSAMAATLGTMRVTEQIDALEAMAVDPVEYLAAPRLVAALIAVPLLVALFDVIGIGAAYVYGTASLGLDGGTFLSGIRDAVAWADVAGGLWKSLAFGGLMAWVACFEGFEATRGARGVGLATTRAVVVVSVAVLAGDYALTALLF